MIWMLCKGHTILARRWKSRVGEIDLIVRRGMMLIFIEVKFRSSPHHALVRITDHLVVPGLRQRQRIMRATQAFAIQQRSSDEFDWRFDIVQMQWPSWKNWKFLHHTPNAWTADGL